MSTLRWSLAALAVAALTAVPVGAQEESSATVDDPFRADALRFQLIEEYTRTIEHCMARISEMSAMDHGAHKVTREQEDHASNKLVRYTERKEQGAAAIEHIIYRYFMQERLGNWPGLKKNPEGYASEGYRTYTKMLELLHSASVYTLWCRELTMPGKARAVRNYMGKFRKLWEDRSYTATRRGNSDIPH